MYIYIYICVIIVNLKKKKMYTPMHLNMSIFTPGNDYYFITHSLH